MINWAKFSNPYSSESAHLSDRIYPLSHNIVSKCVDSIDHTQCLMQSDMLQNAEDRRFALAQSSPSRRAYNFRTNKVEQIAGAIDTLSNYLNHRTTNRNSPLQGPMDIQSLTHDLAGTGTATTDLDTDVASECHLSPSPTAQQPKYLNRPYLRPVSHQHPPPSHTHSSITRVASTENTGSTAPTNVNRLSIADLIHPTSCPKSPFKPRRTFSPLLTPDPTVHDSVEVFHSPDPQYLRQTLDSIRNVRRIYPHHLDSPGRSPQSPSSPQSQSVARSLRLCRMRRSSKTRDHKSKQSSMAIPRSTPAHQNDFEALPDSLTAPDGKNEGTLPPEKKFQLTSASLDRWWAAETNRHERCHTESPEMNRVRLSTGPRTIVDPIIEVDPAVDAGPLVPAVEERDESTTYAYTRPQDENTVETTYRYGYIAGDVPQGERSRARIRGRTRGRRSRIGMKSHLETEAEGISDAEETDRKIFDDHEQGSDTRGIGKRKRESKIAQDSPTKAEIKASEDGGPAASASYTKLASARTYNDPQKLTTGSGLGSPKRESWAEAFEDEPGLDEEELAELREARARAKKWWNEPLWPSTCPQED
jgi:hypothetical protein